MPSSTSSHSHSHHQVPSHSPTRPCPPSSRFPALPTPAHVSPSFGGHPQPLQRTQGSRYSRATSWGSDLTASSEWFIINNEVVLPMQVGGGAEVPVPWQEQGPTEHRRALETSTNRGTSTCTTVSSYTSIYPLSSQSSDSHGSMMDTDAVTGSYRGHSLYDSSCTAREQDWAPWLSNSPPPEPKSPLGSDFFADQAGAAGLPPSPRPAGRRRIRRSVLVANNTFYLPPLARDDVPTLASPPRRGSKSPTPSRADSPPPKLEATSVPHLLPQLPPTPGCGSWFLSCLPMCGATEDDPDDDGTQLIRKRELQPVPKPRMTVTIPRTKPSGHARSRPKASAQFRHGNYRISLVEDRRWRANLLNQAVTQSLTSPLMPPAPSFSKNRGAWPPTATYHQLH